MKLMAITVKSTEQMCTALAVAIVEIVGQEEMKKITAMLAGGEGIVEALGRLESFGDEILSPKMKWFEHLKFTKTVREYALSTFEQNPDNIKMLMLDAFAEPNYCAAVGIPFGAPQNAVYDGLVNRSVKRAMINMIAIKAMLTYLATNNPTGKAYKMLSEFDKNPLGEGA